MSFSLVLLRLFVGYTLLLLEYLPFALYLLYLLLKVFLLLHKAPLLNQSLPASGLGVFLILNGLFLLC